MRYIGEGATRAYTRVKTTVAELKVAHVRNTIAQIELKIRFLNRESGIMQGLQSFS